MIAGAQESPYRSLDDARIVETIARLRDRIAERFPGSSLTRVAEELLALAGEAADCVAYLRRPLWPVRLAVALVIVVMGVVIGALLATSTLPTRVDGMADFLGLVESMINDLVYLGIAVFFLITMESRLKRRRALPALHELRSVIHIVDMHQLTKDPERLLSGQPDTASSPKRTMTQPELGRYLDYCTELLSLSSKVAALFVQHFNDPVVLATVNEIEGLAATTSSKLWQKITLLQREPAAAAPGR